MAVKKTKILVVAFDCDETETFDTKAEAEYYINDALSNGVSIDDFQVYEIINQLSLEETTKVTITD